MRYSILAVFILSAGMGLANMIATVTTTTSGFMQAHNTGEFSAGVSLDGGSAGASYDGGSLFALSAGAHKGSGPGQVISTISFEYSVLVEGTNQPGFLRLSFNVNNLDPVLIGPIYLQDFSGEVQGVTIGDSLPPPNVIYVPYQAGVPVSIHASLSAIAGAADVSFPGDMDASLDVFVSSLVRSEMSDDAIIRGASWVIVPEPATFGFALAGLVLIGGRLVKDYWPRRVSTGSTAAGRDVAGCEGADHQDGGCGGDGRSEAHALSRAMLR